MATPHTIHRNKLKIALKRSLGIQEARLVENRYRTLRLALHSEYPNLINGTDKEVMLGFLKDAIYLDRLLRKATEGIQPEEKIILSQEFQLEELGAEMSLDNNIKKLNNI